MKSALDYSLNVNRWWNDCFWSPKRFQRSQTSKYRQHSASETLHKCIHFRLFRRIKLLADHWIIRIRIFEEIVPQKNWNRAKKIEFIQYVCVYIYSILSQQFQYSAFCYVHQGLQYFCFLKTSFFMWTNLSFLFFYSLSSFKCFYHLIVLILLRPWWDYSNLFCPISFSFHARQFADGCD